MAHPARFLTCAALAALLAACATLGSSVPPATPAERAWLLPADIPQPAHNLSTPARVELGKALFFDEQVGSDGAACARCHFSAGAGSRIQNQLSPGLEGITKSYPMATKEGVYAPPGGSPDIAKADFEFYTEAGQMQGPAAELKVEGFWYLPPLERARKALGS